MLRFAEFFAGIGLMRKGLEQAGWSCAFANDICLKKAPIYTRNFGLSHEENHLLVADIAEVKTHHVPAVELVTASFPCQDLSLAGNRGGLIGSRSGTFRELIRILRELKEEGRSPASLLLENVPGLLSSNKGRDLKAVLDALNELGYGCDLLVIDAVHFLPQSRPRLFIVGTQITSNYQNYRSSYPQKHLFRPEAVLQSIQANPDVDWRPLSLPLFTPRRTFQLAEVVDKEAPFWSDEVLLKEFATIRGKSRERVEAAKFTAHLLNRELYLTGYRRTRKGQVCLELRDDGVAGCLRTTSGGSSRQILMRVAPTGIQLRYLTAREYGRLMGVEDNFWVPGENMGRFAFGDAVAVPVIQWLGELIKTI